MTVYIPMTNEKGCNSLAQACREESITMDAEMFKSKFRPPNMIVHVPLYKARRH